MWVFYLTEVAVNCGYFRGFWSSPKNCCFVKGRLGKCMHLPPRWASGKKLFALCCSLKLENTALLSQNARPAKNCSSGTLLLQMHLTQKRKAALCLLRPNNLMEFNKFYGLLRTFNSSLTWCSKSDGKVHWLHGRNKDRVNWGRMSHTGTWETLRKSLPLGHKVQTGLCTLKTPYVMGKGIKPQQREPESLLDFHEFQGKSD